MSNQTEKFVNEVIERIKPANKEWAEKAKVYIDGLVKPVGSLGKLESIAIQLASIQGVTFPEINKKVTLVMAADNGIVEENVASTPVEVTKIVTLCMAKGVSGICALSKAVNADVSIYDIGINGDVHHENIHNIKTKNGTNNFLKEPAMTKEDTIKAIREGIKAVKDHVDRGYNLIGTGEMGIGNTTTSSAIIMSLLQRDANEVVGKGAGLTDDGLVHKKKVITKAVKQYNLFEADPITVLMTVGGFDIAGLVGVFLGTAYYQVPVVIDGVISVAAALVAYKLNPVVSQYMIASHCTVEPAYKYAIGHMDMSPMLQLDMRLGEGTGCPLAFSIIEAACEMVRSIIPFKDVNLDTDFMIDMRS